VTRGTKPSAAVFVRRFTSMEARDIMPSNAKAETIWSFRC